MVAEYKIYIAGKWTESESGETFESLNPATGKTIGSFQKGSREDTRKAIESAENSFDGWRKMPPPKRGEILLRASRLLRENKERLAGLVTLEMGKVLAEARGDVQEAIDVAEYMAAEGRRLFGHTTTSELRSKFAMTIRMPLGVVGLITPWNFPVAIPAWKIMPALICGNAVVLKPSSDTPLCATEFVRILEKAGVPKGVLNLVTGTPDGVGKEIVTNRKVRGVSFTGSRETGEWIAKNAGIKRVGLELGGKNGIIVMPDADLELAIDGIIWGGYGTTGQRCTACSRVIAHEKIAGKVERKLLSRVRRLRVGDGKLKTTDVGPLINRHAVEKVHGYVAIGRDEGARLLAGGEIINRQGFFYRPTLFSDVAADMRIAQEEIFGPVVGIIEAKNIDHAIDIMNSVRYGLSSAIYTNNVEWAFAAIQNIEAGITYVNASTIGAEVHLPFGGMKETGNGTREAGIEGINEFSEIKAVYIDYSGKLQRAQIDAG
ncbi:MAG: aldehyde dehydrogenase family protein [Candidatus Aenigmarchaeota archaeon]|nr:aldehyde dehydrogenase family protein [Candidatus Aenigmarchaeota archaeon]